MLEACVGYQLHLASYHKKEMNLQKKLVSLKSGLKGKEAISEMKGLGEIKGKVVLCAQGVKDKTKKVLSKKIY